MFPTDNIDVFTNIFTATKKYDLEKYCSSITAHGDEFATLIAACDTGFLPWKHQIYLYRRNPKYLEEILSSYKPKSSLKETRTFGNAMRQIFIDRTLIVGHIFFVQDYSNWHFIFFDKYSQPNQSNHWKFGPHIHLVNYLWPQYDIKSVWDRFCNFGKLPNKSLHIKYTEPGRGIGTVTRASA